MLKSGWAHLFLLFIFSLFSIIETAWQDENGMENGEIDMVFFNLPHGEATLITNYYGDNILINTGSEKSEKSLNEQLKQMGITEIDQVIISNEEEAYSGNLQNVITKYHVNKAILPESFEMEQNQSVKIEKWQSDKVYTLFDHLMVQNIDISKDDEISFMLHYGEESVLFLNDGNISIEPKLIDQHRQVDILKIAEFGSGESPSQRLLKQINPIISIIFHSNKHEINEDLIERLNASWIDIYFLKQSGTVYVRMSQSDYELLS
ncbi:hydrolase [Gracilibacillus dipsosauri]|uniref:Hydrolase n=1 Tax=Gracilibacillus dipsosauri TaxID=178340 RepID=A0A317KZ22_9BACI|nr:hydrolase [Gracilibacillus dipsosauri]PWU68665.1 hydrolase [Gracilibacillus dipsosauri]